MRSRSIGIIAVAVLMASACSGGGDDGGALAPGVDTSEDDASEADDSSKGDDVSEDPAADGPSGAAATVTIGSETHSLEGDVACLTGAATSVTFANGSDEISITDTGDVVLIRMTFDGEDWVDAGSAPAPEVTGEGEGAVVRWSGEMSRVSNGVSESVSLEVSC